MSQKKVAHTRTDSGEPWRLLQQVIGVSECVCVLVCTEVNRRVHVVVTNPLYPLPNYAHCVIHTQGLMGREPSEKNLFGRVLSLSEPLVVTYTPARSGSHSRGLTSTLAKTVRFLESEVRNPTLLKRAMGMFPLARELYVQRIWTGKPL